MNKLVMLNEVRKEKRENNNQSNKESYILFKNKFFDLQNKDIEEDIKIKSKKIYMQKKLNDNLKRIFSLKDKTVFINFINAVYDDCLSSNTKINYISDYEINEDKREILNNASYQIIIQAIDDYRKFQYDIQFQTQDDKNIVFSIKKKYLSLNCNNILNLNQKREEYQENGIKKEEKLSSILVSLNSSIEIPDSYELKIDRYNKIESHKIDIIKSWKYDFKGLIDKNMYLLFPLKVFDLKKRLHVLKNNEYPVNEIKKEIVIFFKDMNRYLGRIKRQGIIDDSTIDEFNLIAMNLLNEYADEELSIK